MSILERISNMSHINCPECQNLLDEIRQEYPDKYKLEPVIMLTCWNKECKIYGMTWAIKTWKEKYPKHKWD